MLSEKEVVTLYMHIVHNNTGHEKNILIENNIHLVIQMVFFCYYVIVSMQFIIMSWFGFL